MNKQKSRKAFTLVELLVVIVILGILMALLLPAIASAIKNAKITNCANNLSQMTKSMYNYSVTKMESEGSFPGEKGVQFWDQLRSKGGKMGEIEDPKVFNCPLGQFDAMRTHYGGPKSNVNAFSAGSAIGCDLEMVGDASVNDPHGKAMDPSVAYCWVAKSGDTHKTPADGLRWANQIIKTVGP